MSDLTRNIDYHPAYITNLSTDSTTAILHGVIIIGAGPCGLAVAARLREHTPSAIFTEEEQRRYYWVCKHAARSSLE